MSAVCSICSSKITNQRKATKCMEKACQNACHQECLGLNKSAETWRCKDCAEPTLIDLMREIKGLSLMNKDLVKSLESCHEKIDEINNLMKNQELKVAQCVSKIEELSVTCEKLEKENNDLKVNLNSQQQYTRLNGVEIAGIPEKKEENILSTIGHLYKALNIKFDTSYIDCCYRMNKRYQSAEPRNIFLRFISRMKRDEFINAKRTRKTLCLSDVNVDWVRTAHEAKKPIYINESLTDMNRILFSKCREVKKKENIKYLWIKNGKILMRKSEDASVCVINSVSDLNDVH